MLIKEFNCIWDIQAKHHPILNEVRPDPIAPNHPDHAIRNQFFQAIFFQRPLKSVAPMVGNCALEPSLPRAPSAQPAVQKFRIEKQLADLRWGVGRRAPILTSEQKNVIRELLLDPDKLTKEGKLTFEKVYKALEEKKLRPGSLRTLNMERSSREDLTGDRTNRVMRDLGVLETWRSLDDLTQLRIINFLADLGSPEQVDQPEWHERFTRKIDPQVVSFVNRLVELEKFDRLGNMGFETGRASYSIRALNYLTQRMHDSGCDEHDAIALIYPSEAPTGELLMQLPPHKPTGNVVVDVALRMVRRAVNDALTKLGKPPSEVVIELSRDMALGVKARNDIETKIKKNQRRRNNARDELNKHGITATETNILRYLLWEQQDTKHCPYCTRHITIAQAFSGNEANFEHILPRSLTQVGKQRNQLILAHRSCNDEKGDRTPFEAFHHDEERWAAVKYCASVLKANKQFAKERLLLLNDYEHETLDDATLTDFSERQFIETSWIGKLTAQWLRLACSNVAVSRGMLTAHLRRIWKLETVIPQARLAAGLPVLDQDGDKITIDDFSRFKAFWEGHSGREHERTDRKIEKRIDHRHHLIDALVIAMTSRSLYMRMAAHYKALAERREHGEPVRMKLSVEPPLSSIRDKALTLTNDPHITHKPDRLGGGAFFQDFAYSSALVDDETTAQLCRRKRLATLVTPKDDHKKARTALLDIQSETVRKLVLDTFEARITLGMTAFQALQEPIDYPAYGTQIKTANFICGSAENAAIIAHPTINGPHQKRLIDAGWACLKVQFFGKKVATTLVSPRMFAKAGHEAADDMVTYFKGDTVRDGKSQATYLIRQIKAKNGGTLITTPIVDAREVKKMSASEGLKTFSGKALMSLTRL